MSSKRTRYSLFIYFWVSILKFIQFETSTYTFGKGLLEKRTKTFDPAANISNTNTHHLCTHRFVVNILKSNIYEENTLLDVRTMDLWYPQNHLTWG